MDTSTRYLERLIDRQRREGWSDREMGRQLGLGKSTWHRVKRGERPFTLYILRHCMARFPEYNGEAFLFLSTDVPDGDTHATEPEAAHVA